MSHIIAPPAMPRVKVTVTVVSPEMKRTPSGLICAAADRVRRRKVEKERARSDETSGRPVLDEQTGVQPWPTRTAAAISARSSPGDIAADPRPPLITSAMWSMYAGEAPARNAAASSAEAPERWMI